MRVRVHYRPIDNLGQSPSAGLTAADGDGAPGESVSGSQPGATCVRTRRAEARASAVSELQGDDHLVDALDDAVDADKRHEEGQ